MPNELAQPQTAHNLDSEIATLLYLLHTQALCKEEQPNCRSASNIHHLLRAMLNRSDLSELLRNTCEDLRDTWSNAVNRHHRGISGGCA